MAKEFKKPNLKSRDIEIRCEDGAVIILATEHGLRRIIANCKLLMENSPDVQHQHLESQGLLTKESLKCTIRMFSKEEI